LAAAAGAGGGGTSDGLLSRIRAAAPRGNVRP
jgi:hypothetical protein